MVKFGGRSLETKKNQRDGKKIRAHTAPATTRLEKQRKERPPNCQEKGEENWGRGPKPPHAQLRPEKLPNGKRRWSGKEKNYKWGLGFAIQSSRKKCLLRKLQKGNGG